MVLGTLASVEMALKIQGVPHSAGGVDAAMAFLAGETEAVSAKAA
jgi:alanine-glyoxylate transaminase/serine-glyoxylate transaminase/serine-pyruvate transaminase